MSLRLRDVTNNDLPLIEQWLHADHVRSTWDDPGANLRLLNEPSADRNWRAIIEADGRKVGSVLWQHPTGEELDVDGLADIPTNVIDVAAFFEQLGPFDHLITAAAGTARGKVTELDTAIARNLFESKYWGQYHCGKYGAPRMNSSGAWPKRGARRPSA